jgi:hypothetical protein
LEIFIIYFFQRFLFGDFNGRELFGIAASELDASSKQLSVVEIPVRSLPKIPE